MSPANRAPLAQSDSDDADEDHQPIERAPPPALTARDALFTGPFLRLLAMQAAFGFAFSVFVLLPKVLAATFGSTPAQIGLVMASFGLASLLSIPLVGRVVDRAGHRATLVLANLLMAMGALGFLFVSGAGALAVISRGVQGAAWSLAFAAAMAVAADLAPAARLGQAVGMLGSASLAMNALAPTIAEPLGERLGHRAIFALAAGAGLLGALLARRLPARTAPHTVDAAGDTPPPAQARRLGPYVVLCAAGLAFSVMFTFIAPFALERGIRAVRGFFAAYTVAALAVRVLAGRMADRLGHRRVACAATVVYGLAVLAAGVVGPGPLVALGAGFGAAHGAAFPALMALVLARAPGRARTRALAVANGAMNLGVAGVLGLGLVAGRLGYPTVFVVAGTLMLLMAAALARD
jgi:MFS family permease